MLKNVRMRFNFRCDVFLTVLSLLFREIRSARLPPIYWNSTNPMFSVDREPPALTVKIRDRIDIHCPFYPKPGVEAFEYHELYMVTKDDFNNCHRDERAKIVGVCIEPEKDYYFTLVIRRFTATPNGLEFTPGKTYFLMSTSKGPLSDVQNPRDGLCKTHNMRLKLSVDTGGRRWPTTPPPRPKTSPGVASEYFPLFPLPTVHPKTAGTTRLGSKSSKRPYPDYAGKHKTFPVVPRHHGHKNSGKSINNHRSITGELNRSKNRSSLRRPHHAHRTRSNNSSGVNSYLPILRPNSSHEGQAVHYLPFPPRPSSSQQFHDHDHAAYMIYEEYLPAALKSKSSVCHHSLQRIVISALTALICSFLALDHCL